MKDQKVFAIGWKIKGAHKSKRFNSELEAMARGETYTATNPRIQATLQEGYYITDDGLATFPCISS